MIEQLGIPPSFIYSLFNIFILVVLLFHIVFSFILLRQIQRMTTMVEARISPVLTIVGYLHLIASCLIFLFVLLVA